MQSPALMKVFVNGRVYRYDPRTGSYQQGSALAIDGTRIVAGSSEAAGTGAERIDLDGATVLAAFADCHVHVTDTGYFLDERHFGSVRSYDEYAQAISRLPPDRFVLAGNYDESDWQDHRLADAAPLEHAFPDSYALLTRVDGHSCIVNRKTFSWLNLSPRTEGVELNETGAPTGKLFLSANWQAQSAFFAAVPIEAKRAAEKRATELALSHGALHLHAQLVGFQRDEYAREIEALRMLPAKWYPKICEPDPALAHGLGLPYVGGDVFLDGSIGSCTAAVSAPFLISVDGGAPGSGSLKYSDEQLHEYFARAESLGISAGVHAIGDRAIEQCIATWESVLNDSPSPRARHFIEHFEIARADHIERCVKLGIYLSMQPQFDQLWGGQNRMYDVRLGTERMRSMNALGRIQRAGGILCGGDDSPVCRLDPLAGMQAAVDHHEQGERLTPYEALTMYTYNAALLGHAERETGLLAPGYAADFVLLDRDPLESGRFSDCVVLETWSNGARVF
ncbi:MAG: amidohydrolase family protein [Candidatus Baltobacteraceae bacterium]